MTTATRDTTREGIESSWYKLDVGPSGEAAEVLVAAMKLGGIDHLWFVSGSELTFFQEAIAKAGALGHPAPKIMTMLHEHAALCAAMGESMVSGKPSSVCAHVELGLMNMGGAIHNASRGGYPILIMTGAPATAYPDTVPGSRSHTVFWKQQIRDQGEIVRQYTKWDHSLAIYDNPGLTVTRALQLATSQPTGPVYLSVPREAGQAPISGVQRFPTLDYLTPAGPAAADPVMIREAAKILVKADSPIFVVERLGRNPRAVPFLVELAETLAARVHVAGYRYNFPQPHPLKEPVSRGFSADVSEADAVLVIDTPVPWLPGKAGPPAGTSIITIDVDPVQQSIPIWEFPADLRITADSSLAVPALLEEVNRILTPEDKRRIDQRRDLIYRASEAAAERELAATLEDGKQSKITPRWAGYQLAQLIDDDTAVIGEGGYVGALKRSKSGTIFSHGGASLGFSLAACMGGKIASPKQQFVAMAGDGAYTFGLPQQVYWAAHHYKAPFVALVFNNRGFGTGTRAVVEAYPDGYAVKNGDYEGGMFDPPPDYSAEARAAGCHGEKVTSPDEVGPAIKRALEISDREGVCAVVYLWLPKHITGEV